MSLVFKLTVTDDGGAWPSDTCIVTLRSHRPPVADAGPSQVAREEQIVRLRGSAGSPSGGELARVEWRQISRPPVKLSNLSVLTPFFRVPEDMRAGARLVFELKVTDGFGLGSTDTCSVRVIPEEDHEDDDDDEDDDDHGRDDD